VTTANPTEAGNFSMDRHPPHADRYARAEEFVDVVTGLWESWRDGDFIRDKATGHYVKAEAIRPLNHQGASFSVRGPLDVARSPQGRPVIVQAGSSEPGKNLAARVADVVFTSQQSLAGAQAFYRDVQERAAHFGRSADDVVVITGVLPVIGESDAEAGEKFEALQTLIHPIVALTKTAELMGNIDLSAYPLDEMLPDTLPTGVGFTSRQKGILDLAKRNKMTLRQIANLIGGTRGHLPIIGTARTIADRLEEWFTSHAADGFLLFPTALPESLIEFTTTVVPELQRRGLFRTEYAGTTLRENLFCAR
jgi:FMN-dependent oxidoreductase (nitrilotriacetate monooxygenase family)